MLTVTLQIAAAAVSLVFGWLAWRVGRESVAAFARPSHRTGWWLTGVAFLGIGVSSVVQSSAAAIAYAAGRGSWAWDQYLHWMQPGIYGRVGLLVALAGLLVALALRGRGGVGFRRFSLAAYSALLLAGMVAGGLQGEVVGRGGAHFHAFALVSSGEVALLLVALIVTLMRYALGRYLWMCLALYTAVLTINVGLFSALAWVDIPGAWTPPPGSSQTYTLVGYILMIALAHRRLALARRQQRVRSLLEPLPSERRLNLE